MILLAERCGSRNTGNGCYARKQGVRAQSSLGSLVFLREQLDKVSNNLNFEGNAVYASILQIKYKD